MSFLVGCIRVVHKKHFPPPKWCNKLVEKFVLLFITEHMLVQSSLAFCWLLESFLATPTTRSDPCPPVQSIEPPNHWPNCFVLVQFTVAYFGADCGFKWLTNFQQRPVKYTSFVNQISTNMIHLKSQISTYNFLNTGNKHIDHYLVTISTVCTYQSNYQKFIHNWIWIPHVHVVVCYTSINLKDFNLYYM